MCQYVIIATAAWSAGRQGAPARGEVPSELKRRLSARAVTYVLAQWPKLVRFLEYPDLALSNNLAENAIRPVALGRKNWLHPGSPEAGPRIAAILSVVETCGRLRIDVRT